MGKELSLLNDVGVQAIVHDVLFDLLDQHTDTQHHEILLIFRMILDGNGG